MSHAYGIGAWLPAPVIAGFVSFVVFWLIYGMLRGAGLPPVRAGVWALCMTVGFGVLLAVVPILANL